MKRRGIILMSAVLLLAAGCGKGIVPQARQPKEKQEVKIVKTQDALFCFKCHAYEKYTGAGGKFPHLKHFGIGFHCNQCHDIRGHHHLTTITKKNAPCSGCH